MREIQSRLLIDAGCPLAECPVYVDEKNALYWIDIEKNQIFFLELDTGRFLYTQMDRKIGSIVLTEDGRILAGMDDGVYLVDGLQYQPYCLMLEAAAENVRFNDGKCDPRGRFIVGTRVKPNASKCGHLFSVSGKDTYRVLSSGVGCSNGLAWSLDLQTMYHVDTLSKEDSPVYAFDYNVDTGEASNKRKILNFPLDKKILPDGMTIDENGNLWIAEWGGYGVGCWDPKTGTKLAHIFVPSKYVSCCTFGGEDYATMFITTAAKNGEGIGGVFCAEPGVKGTAQRRYKTE